MYPEAVTFANRRCAMSCSLPFQTKMAAIVRGNSGEKTLRVRLSSDTIDSAELLQSSDQQGPSDSCSV